VSAALFAVCQGALLSLGRQEPAVYLLWVAAALGLLASLPSTPLWDRFMALTPRQTVLVLMILALVARFVMLLNTQEHTKDMELLLERTQKALDGETPYTEDFHVNKPPLYLYTAWSLGLLVGAENVPMRAALSLVDVLTVIALFWLVPFGREGAVAGTSTERTENTERRAGNSLWARCSLWLSSRTVNPQDGQGPASDDPSPVIPESRRRLAALGLALCPANIFMIGFSGHYEPFVILSVLLGLGFHLRGRQEPSALLLGLGFAWKFYPALFLPLLLARLPSWRARLLYILLFGVPFVLSLLPILYVNPDGLYDYFFGYQGGDWVEKTLRGFAAGLVVLTDSSDVAGIAWSWVTAGLFGLALALFVLGRWARNPLPAPLPELLERHWRRLMELTRRLDPVEGEIRPAGRGGGANGSADGVDLGEEASDVPEKEPSIQRASRPFIDERRHLALWANRALLLFALYHLWQWTQEWVLHPQGGIQLSRGVGAAIVIIGTLLLITLYLSPWWPRLFLNNGNCGGSAQLEEEAGGTHSTALPRLFSTYALFLGSIIVVLLVLWGSPDYCAWYSMWLIPLALLLPRSWGRWWLCLLLLANIP